MLEWSARRWRNPLEGGKQPLFLDGFSRNANFLMNLSVGPILHMNALQTTLVEGITFLLENLMKHEARGIDKDKPVPSRKLATSVQPPLKADNRCNVHLTLP